MSYILEALKKADRERTLGDVPDLETAHWGERHGRRSFRWAWIVVLLLLVNGALLAYLLGRDDTAAESAARVAIAPAEEPPVYKAPRADTTALQPSARIKQPREQAVASRTGMICRWSFAAGWPCRTSMCMSTMMTRHAASYWSTCRSTARVKCWRTERWLRSSMNQPSR